MAEEQTIEHFVRDPSGTVHRVRAPIGATSDEVTEFAKASALKGYNVMNPMAEDVGRSILAAPRKTVEGMAGLPGTAQHGINAGLDYAFGVQPPKEMPHSLATPADIQAQTSKVLGPSYQPQTMPGEIAGGAAEGATGAMIGGGGGVLGRLGIGVISGAGSEVARQQAGDTLGIPASIGGGLVAGLAAILAGKGVTGYRNMLAGKKTGEEIGAITGQQPIPSGSVRLLAGDVASDRLTPQGAQATADALGPEARLLDTGRQFEQRAAVGLSRIPGQAQTDILDVLQGRTGTKLPTGKYDPGAASADRFRADFDAALATPVHDMVQLRKTIEQQFGPATAKAYKDVMDSHPYVWDDTLKNLLDRDVIKNAYKTADRVASNYGEKISLTDPPSLRTWDFVKKGIDTRINSLMKGGTLSGTEAADLGGLLSAKRALVDHLDTITNGAYKHARSLSATEKGLHEASDFGSMFFNNRVLPEILKEQFDDLSLAEQAVAKASIRREIDRQMGSVSNDAAKARSLFDQNNVKQKVEYLFGNNAADVIEKRVNREKAFQETTNTATKQSITNLAGNVTEQMKDVPHPNMSAPTLYGALTHYPRMGAQYLHDQWQGMEGTRRGSANVLLTPNQGNQIPGVIQALMDYNTKTGKNTKTTNPQQAAALIRALMAEQAGRQ